MDEARESLKRDEPSGRALAGRAVWALGAKLGGTLAAFALQVVLARWLGKEGFGAYILAFTWMGLAVLLAKQGLDSAALRFLPGYRNQGDEAREAACVRSSRHRVLGAGFVLAIVGALCVLLLRDRIGPELRLAAFPFLLAVPTLALGQLEAAFLQAHGRIRASQFPTLVLLPLLALGGVLALRALGRFDARPVFASAVYLGSAIAVLVLLVSLRRSALPLGPAQASSDRPWFPVGRALLLSAGFGLVLVQADVLMLGAFAGSAATGPYAAATRLARFLALPLLAGNAVLAPRFAALHTSGRRRELQALVRRASLAMAAVTFPLTIALALFAVPVLELFGPGFAEARLPLFVLLAGQCVNVAMGSVGYLMTMTGGHGAAARILGACALLNLVANALLIPRFGPLGAAWATALTTALWNLTMYFAARARLGIRPSFF